jgi:hypothetical protein
VAIVAKQPKKAPHERNILENRWYAHVTTLPKKRLINDANNLLSGDRDEILDTIVAVVPSILCPYLVPY